ncbi:MAG: DUF2272 domain-containing protein, partial [Saprospiraceae bacterium]|nr:DUF2272 domain-containing protein [Saprospiraceae bacterium]
MKTSANKENSTPSPQPFFNKKQEVSFLSPTNEPEQPFFSPNPGIQKKTGSPFFSGGENFGINPDSPHYSQPAIQPKLTINEPDDPYEQEADAMADRVMRMEANSGNPGDNKEQSVQILPSATSHLQRQEISEEDQPIQMMPLPIQRECAECEAKEKEALQTKPLMRKSEGGGYTASPQLTSQLNSSKGGGNPLPKQTLNAMNQAFGTDFSTVRIHTDGKATEMSMGIRAKAFTHGSDIYFNQGQYNPESRDGKKLLAHELTHVEQQSNHHHLPPQSQVPGIQLQSASSPGQSTSTVALQNRPEFAHSGFDEETHPEIVNPWSSAMESELSRLSRYARGFADRGRSELVNPFQDQEIAQLNQEIIDFVNRFLSAGSSQDRDQMVQLVRRYLDGYSGATPTRDDIEDNVERQHGGYDAMAALIAQHSGGPPSDRWNLSNSPQLMQLLHDMGYWQDLDRRVVAAAEGEYQSWTDPADPQGRQRSESHPTSHITNIERFRAYWEAGGRTGAGATTAAQGSYTDAAAFPWSAAFISFVMREAGAGDTFNYSTGHSYYAVAARNNEQNNESAVTHPSRLLNAASEPVHVGGLIHRTRSSGTSGVTYDNLSPGDRTHADVVVGIQIYNADGVRVPGHYQDIIDNTDASVLSTFQIFAVTIGGNTIDQELNHSTSTIRIDTRSRSGSVAGVENETVGRRFWRLNSDLTIDNSSLPGTISVYGIQRMENPPRSDQNDETGGVHRQEADVEAGRGLQHLSPAIQPMIQRVDSHDIASNVMSATGNGGGRHLTTDVSLDERSQRRVYERIAALRERDPVTAGVEFEAMDTDARSAALAEAVTWFQGQEQFQSLITQIRGDNEVPGDAEHMPMFYDARSEYNPSHEGSDYSSQRATYTSGLVQLNDVTMQALANAWPQSLFGHLMTEAQAYDVLRQMVIARGLPFNTENVNVIGMRAFQGGAIHDNGEVGGGSHRPFTEQNRYDDTTFILSQRD